MPGAAPVTIPTIADLQATDYSSYPTVLVLGYNAIGDGGGGQFNWNAISIAAEDRGTIFKTGGLTTGRFIRQLTGQPITVDMFGAYSDNTHPIDTLAAFQAANDYVAASTNPCQEIRMPGAQYNLGSGNGVVKAVSHFGPRWVGNGQSTAVQSTLITFTPTSEKAAFTFIGYPGSITGAGVRDVIFTGNSNAIGIEFQGQCGCQFDVSAFGPVKRVVLLHNNLIDQFTEFTTGIINTNGAPSGIGTVLEYRVTNGKVSFNGSGLVGGAINFIATSYEGAILIGPGAFPYNAPLSATFFPQYSAGNTTIVRNASATAYGEPFFYGDIRIEQGVSAAVYIATGPDIFIAGNILYFGNAGLWHMGSAVLGHSFGTTPSGAATTFFKPINTQAPLTGASSSLLQWPKNAYWNHYKIVIEVRGNNYLAFATADLIYDEGAGCYYTMSQNNNIRIDTPGYRNPVISANTTNILLSSSGVPYNGSANLVASVTVTQIGQGSGHHNSQ